MSDDLDLKERIRALEQRENRLSDMITSVEKNIDRLSLMFEHMEDIKPRMRELEMDMMNQKLITKAVQWLGVAVGGTGIVLILNYLFGKGF